MKYLRRTSYIFVGIMHDNNPDSNAACTKQHVGRVLSTAKHAVRTEDLRMAVRSELVAGDHVAFVNAHSAWSYTIGRVIKEATTNMGASDTQEPKTKKPRRISQQLLTSTSRSQTPTRSPTRSTSRAPPGP